MAQEIDPFNPTEVTKQTDMVRPFSLKHYDEVEGMKGVSLELSNQFKELAHRIANELPDGNLRTVSIERLLDIRGSICNFLKVRK